MANQKSQIYPIQLQGAELNLNKFDGEIKQYSGFNKNNSPFVGGCLSNLFTKDTQMPGYDSENTYIDSNGDVYRVTAEGLFKNDEKVLNTNGASFYNVERLNLPEDTVCVNAENENIFLTFDEDLYVHFGDNVRNVIDDYNSVCYLSSSSMLYHQIISFSSVIETVENLYAVCLQIYTGFEGYSNRYYTVCIFYDKETNTPVYSFAIEIDVSHATDVELMFGQLSILKKTTYFGSDSIAILALFPNILNRSMPYNRSSSTQNLCSVIAFNANTNEFLGVKYILNNTNLSAYSSVLNWFYFASGNGSGSCSCVGKTNAFRAVYTFSYDQSFSYCNLSISQVRKYDTNYDIKGVDYSKCILNNNGILWAGRVYQSSTGKFVDLSVKVNGFGSNSGGYDDGDRDTITPYATYEDEKCSSLIGHVLSRYILINNAVVSGLCLPNGKILISDWNSVDCNYIFINRNNTIRHFIIWKNVNENKWYKLKLSTPLLKYINGQIIINADSTFNSYRIRDKKKLLYAPAWNNRILFYANGFLPDLRDAEEYQNTYFASSINEYNLADNSSIIIPPVKINISIQTYNLQKNINNMLIKDIMVINVYMGTDEIKYHFSIINSLRVIDFENIIFINSLEDLQYPLNADSNILYSPCLFADIKSFYGNKLFIKNENTYYPLIIGNNNEPVMNFYLASGIDNLDEGFVIQGQFYGVINKGLYALQYLNGVLTDVSFVVSVENLQFCGNTPYEAYFFSPTNRCLYSFVGSNVLQQKQFVDKIGEVRNYRYNPATQSVFLFTDIGLITISAFGMYLIERQWKDLFLREKGVTLINDGMLTDLQYYDGEELDKQNIKLETCFYGMNNETVTINDCLYLRLFSEEHEEGVLKVSATTISLSGRKTEETTFKIRSTDWDKVTHTIYLRYQPKVQRGLGVSFSIDSPFKIASMSVGSQPDSILIDKVSKGAINAPQRTSNNVEW